MKFLQTTFLASTVGALIALSVGSAQAAEVDMPIMADTLLAGHSSEYTLNCGARERLRVKGFQGIVLLRFDMSSVEGGVVNGGTLSVYTVGLSGESTTETISEGVSSVASDWIEGTGDYTEDSESATYAWPGAAAGAAWGSADEEPSNRYGPNDAMDVIGGFGGSIANSVGEFTFIPETWTDIALDAALVQGLVDGTQYGIAITRNSVGVNLDLASREYQGGALAATLVVDMTVTDVEAQGKLAATWGELKGL